MFAKLLLLACFAIGAYQDLRSLRVSNWLTIGGALAAGIWLFVSGHSLTGYPPVVVLIGLALALLLSVPGYLLGRLGAADVKALAALALASDPRTVLYTLALASLFCVVVMFASKLLIDSDKLPANCQSQLARLQPSKFKSFPFLLALFAGLLATLSFTH